MREVLAVPSALNSICSAEAGNEALGTEAFCVIAAQLASSASGVPVKTIASTCRDATRRVSGARQVAMYLAHTVAGLPLARVAEHFGRDRTTAAYACRLVEDRRDDQEFDARLGVLEDLMRAVVGAAR